MGCLSLFKQGRSIRNVQVVPVCGEGAQSVVCLWDLLGPILFSKFYDLDGLGCSAKHGTR